MIFIDFSKAYDLVPRKVLFNVLKRFGCGTVMLAALVAMYRTTESGEAVMTATLGVRQGSTTSCFLFVVVINELVKMIKDSGHGGDILQWLHILAFMDDTVLLATSGRGMVRKLEALKTFCCDYGMKMNQDKTKFFVINGSVGDADPIHVDGFVVSRCTSYVCLGSPFTSDGSPSSAVKMHAKNKMCQVLKYASFVKKNNDVPFIVKRRV